MAGTVGSSLDPEVNQIESIKIILVKDEANGRDGDKIKSILIANCVNI